MERCACTCCIFPSMCWCMSHIILFVLHAEYHASGACPAWYTRSIWNLPAWHSCYHLEQNWHCPLNTCLLPFAAADISKLSQVSGQRMCRGLSSELNSGRQCAKQNWTTITWWFHWKQWERVIVSAITKRIFPWLEVQAANSSGSRTWLVIPAFCAFEWFTIVRVQHLARTVVTTCMCTTEQFSNLRRIPGAIWLRHSRRCNYRNTLVKWITVKNIRSFLSSFLHQ